MLRQVEQRGLAAYCRLATQDLRGRGGRYSPAGIDLLHIDGNHDREAATSDPTLYVPTMRLGSIVVMDDVTWPSIHELFEEVAIQQKLLLRLYDSGAFSTFDDFGLARTVNNDSSTRGGTTSPAK